MTIGSDRFLSTAVKYLFVKTGEYKDMSKSKHLAKLFLSIFTVIFVCIMFGCVPTHDANNMTSSNSIEKEMVTITIAKEVYPGSTEYLVKIMGEESTASVTITYSYNPVTEEELFQGDLSPIYQAVLGELPQDLSSNPNPDLLLDNLEAYGWGIVDDVTVEDAEGNAMVSEVRTVTMHAK